MAGLQGQVPKADQDSGRSRQGYRCNLRLIGQQDIQSCGGNFRLRRGLARRGRRAVLSGSVRDGTVGRVVGRVRAARRVR